MPIGTKSEWRRGYWSTGPSCPSDRQRAIDAAGRAERQTHGRSTGSLYLYSAKSFFALVLFYLFIYFLYSGD